MPPPPNTPDEGSRCRRAVRSLPGALLALALLLSHAGAAAQAAADPSGDWPPATRDCRPHAYWWWLGSAVDRVNLTKELERYQAAGMGGVHIIPIYGAKGWEDRYVPYLSPAWMELLRHTVSEGRRLDLNVDMTTGTGWCFGGPKVTADEASSIIEPRILEIPAGGRPAESFRPNTTLIAYGPAGRMLDVSAKLDPQGQLDWQPADGPWQLYALSSKPTSRVKRAAPGGAGFMLNLFYAPAMANYLTIFDAAFKPYDGLRPRAMYHDSYEYQCNWAPDLFAQFEKRRGYPLQRELPALFGTDASNDRSARLRCDFRETLSDLMIEETLPQWVRWCHGQGIQTRNQAHGSPGNLLDLYALADIPETEMFDKDRSKLVSMFASSAAHVAGRRLVAAETGTWLREHFTETLGDLKGLLDELFLAGVNHVIYHGTCYSPDEVDWPGWLFYASYEMNPRNPVWRDVPALNAYVTRCQSVLQTGQPENDILVYWPIHELWRTPGGLELKLTVHQRDWLQKQPLGTLAAALWQGGFGFDYASDRQLAQAKGTTDGIVLPGGRYRVIVVPQTRFMPVETLARLLDLARSGACVVFENRLPEDVPGLNQLDVKRELMTRLLREINAPEQSAVRPHETALGLGKVLVGGVPASLDLLGIQAEPLMARAGVSFVRRADDAGYWYFLVNESTKPLAAWVPLTRPAASVRILDPLTGRSGCGTVRKTTEGATEVYLNLAVGESLILRTLTATPASGPAWSWWQEGTRHPLEGTWEVSFLHGGPVLPESFKTDKLASWTELGGTETQRFGGTARYQLTFDAPVQSGSEWFIELGRVCQSARVRLNDRDLGTVFTAPFRVLAPALKPTGNKLEIEVTSVAANRIRDLDLRKVPWKNFHEINFVNINYKPFDAATWPLTAAGLLGPVTLAAAVRSEPR